jgi:hypothetical protein
LKSVELSWSWTLYQLQTYPQFHAAAPDAVSIVSEQRASNRLGVSMSFRTVAAVSMVLLTVGMSLVQAQPPKVRLPDESAGIDTIARTLIAAFDQVDIVLLGEVHWQKLDSDLRLALVRQPDFAKKVRSIVVEFASTAEQSTLDRYIRGENVPPAQLERVWKNTSQAANGVWDSPIYAEFFAAVREVNLKLSAEARIRVLAGDPPVGSVMSRDASAISVLKEQVLQKHGKALVIYGAGHFYRTRDYVDDIGIATTLESEYPGRTLAVIPVGYKLEPPPGVTLRFYPDYKKFDRAVKTQERPVLVPLQRSPFQDFTAEEFAPQIFTCLGPGGCRSVFQGSKLTLGQMADAVVYVGAGVDTKAKPAR